MKLDKSKLEVFKSENPFLLNIFNVYYGKHLIAGIHIVADEPCTDAKHCHVYTLGSVVTKKSWLRAFPESERFDSFTSAYEAIEKRLADCLFPTRRV